MSRNEKDYSSYLAYESIAVQVLALFCGFTFTAITLLLTLLPDPSSIVSQVTLFFLALLFDICIFVLSFSIYYLSYCIEKVPPEARGRRTVGTLFILVLILWGAIVVLLFTLWNLTYLALASGIVYVMSTVLSFVFIWKPFFGQISRSQAVS